MNLEIHLPTDSTATSDQARVLRIGEWRADPVEATLRSENRERRLEPKVMELLFYLAERPGELVGREEIFERVWQGRAVVDGALSRAVSLLRRALGDDKNEPRYIETVPRKGYRLVAEVEWLAEDGAISPIALSAIEPPVVDPTGAESPRAGGKEPWAFGGWRIGVVGLGLALLVVVGFLVWSGGSEPDPDSSEEPSHRQGPIRLAVLPLDSLGPSTDDDYLADGLTEELIHQLSALSALGVVSRTSVIAAEVSGLTAPEIARQLDVDYFLEGSVMVDGERLRITVQLIAPSRDEHLWSRTFDRTLADVLDLHRQVALEVTAQVKAELTLPEQSRLAARGTVDGEAYRLYLKGLQHLDRRTRKDLKQALELLSQSVELAPDLSVALAALAKVHMLSELYMAVPQAQAYARAQEAVDRALALDPGLPSAHVSQGLLRLTRDWDWEGAETAYRMAIRRAPSYALAHQWLSECLSLAGRHAEAMVAIEAAVELDPLSPLVHAAWGQRLNAAGRHAEALQRFRAADDLGARFAWHWREVAYAHERLGDRDAALEAHVERMRRRGVKGEAMEELQRAIAADGLPGYWRWQYQRLVGMRGSEPALLAEALAGSGAYEEAWPWLRAAIAKRGSWFLHLEKSPAFDPLREDPRFGPRFLDRPDRTDTR